MKVVKAVCKSDKKGVKFPIAQILLIEAKGVEGDFHAGTDRQVSLLAEESINKMREKGLELEYGAFGENIATQGIELLSIPIGAKLKIGNSVELQITEIGKKCPAPCEIFYQTGDCIMPREGVFAKVLKGGKIAPGDEIIL